MPAAAADIEVLCRNIAHGFVDASGNFSWSSGMLETALEAAAVASGGLPERLFREVWSLMADRELDENCYQFCRDVGRQTLGAYRHDTRWDLSWMLGECSPSQACFRYWVIGVRPDLWSDDLEANTMEILSRFSLSVLTGLRAIQNPKRRVHEMDALAEIGDRYRGARVWNVKRGVGTFLTFEVGTEVESGGGQLHVWVQYASWSLRKDGRQVLCSDSHAEEYAQALAGLEGQGLRSVRATASGVVLEFSGSYELELVPDLENYDPNDDLVTIYEVGSPAVSFNIRDGVYSE